MKPVDQTKFGLEGNCFSACIASLLEIPLEECNIFYSNVDEKTGNLSDGKHWWDVTKDWLIKRNYYPLYITKDELQGKKPLGLSIMSGMGPRGLMHSTVACDGILVHDPHPSRAGLITITDFIVLVSLTHSREIPK